MRIEQLEALQSNYIFLLVNPADQEAVVIDPGQAAQVLDRLQTLGVTLTGIWHTHHHHDHIGGDRQLLAHYPDAQVYGSRTDAPRIPTLTQFVGEGDRLTFGDRTAQVMEVPGHTLNHLAYYFPPVPSPPPGEQSKLSPATVVPAAPPRNAHNDSPQAKAGASPRDAAPNELPGELFCGDTLFSMGCGRLFEGTPDQMVRSLSRFRQLPDTTRIWCAHEYTESNLEFVRTLTPDNPAIQHYTTQVHQRRALRESTIPSTLKLEKQLNPFLRWDDPNLQHLMGTVNDPIRTFSRLRGRKDLF